MTRELQSRLWGNNIILPRWVAVLILLVAVPLAISFNARLATIRQMHQDEIRLRQAILDEQVRQAELRSLHAYVTSDSYIEHWARVHARMVKPGEVAVIPVAPISAQPTPIVPAARRMPVSAFDEWWTLFFEDTSVP